jgi:hypothetical protein
VTASIGWSDEVQDDEIPERIGVIPSIALTALIIMGIYFSLNPPAEAPPNPTNASFVGKSATTPALTGPLFVGIARKTPHPPTALAAMPGYRCEEASARIDAWANYPVSTD